MSPEFAPFDIHVAKHEDGGKDSQPRDSSETGSKRSSPWPEPEPQRRESRSNRVRSILNPESHDLQHKQQHKQQHKLQHKRPGEHHSMEILPPPTTYPSPQRRSSSSPILAPISRHKSYPPLQQQQQQRSSVSPPHNPPRRIITPVSPAMRLTSTHIPSSGPAGGSADAKVRVSQSPFVPLQELLPGVYSSSTPGSGPGASTPIEPASLANTPRFSPKLAIPVPSRNTSLPPAPLPLSRHSTPTLIHSRHPSSGNNPSSQASSPSTPHSTFSAFTQSSPSMASGLLPPLGQSMPLSRESPLQSPYMSMDSLSRTPSRMSSASRYEDSQQPPFPDHQHQHQHQHNAMIPVTIDLKSGSRSQAEKRKANSDASRRFRNRKKNEAVLEQRIGQLTEQLQCLAEERDHYRAERDFYRDSLARSVGAGQMPSRPPSPRLTQTTATATATSPAAQTAIGGEAMSKSVSTSSSLSLSTSVSDSHAAGQHLHPAYPADSWQGEYSAYREDPRFARRP
jgi:hypothetical protein